MTETLECKEVIFTDRRFVRTRRHSLNKVILNLQIERNSYTYACTFYRDEATLYGAVVGGEYKLGIANGGSSGRAGVEGNFYGSHIIIKCMYIYGKYAKIRARAGKKSNFL